MSVDEIVLPSEAPLWLDATASIEPEPELERPEVQWFILEGPHELEFDISESDPSQVLVSGLEPNQRYLIEAQIPGCGSDIIEVYTAPQNGISMHLLWHAPEDDNEYDDQGLDLDLHVLKMTENSQWYQQPYDCYYANRETNWEGELAALLFDDLNGRGPEIIHIPEPLDCSWYALGIEYYRNRDYGPAYINLNIFKDNQLIYRVEQTELLFQQWWYSAIIHSSGEIFPVNLIDPGPPTQQSPTLSEEVLDSELCGIPELPVLSCNDSLDDISSPETAAALTDAPFVDLAVCPEEPDYFLLESNSPISLAIFPEVPVGAITLELLDNAQNVLITSEGQIITQTLPPGDYLLKISSETISRYNLSYVSCSDDIYSGNNDTDSALLLEPGEYSELSLCGAADYFGVNLQQGDTLNVALQIGDTGSNRNLDLQLLAPEGHLLVESGTEFPLETATLWANSESGIYFVRVTGRTPFDMAEYTLSIATVPAPEGVDLSPDRLAPQNSSVTPGTTIAFVIDYRNLGNSESGPFSIGVYLSEDIEIDDSDILLNTTEFSELPGGSVSTGLINSLIPPDTDGIFYFCAKLDSDNTVDEVNEENNTMCTPEPYSLISCIDSFDPNDDMTAPSLIEPGRYENLKVCSERDYFLMCSTGGPQLLSLDLEFIHSYGDIDVILYREVNLSRVDGSYGVTNEEHVEAVTEDTECFIAEIKVLNNRRNSYSMVFSLEDR